MEANALQQPGARGGQPSIPPVTRDDASCGAPGQAASRLRLRFWLRLRLGGVQPFQTRRIDMETRRIGWFPRWWRDCAARRFFTLLRDAITALWRRGAVCSRLALAVLGGWDMETRRIGWFP